MRTLTEQQRPVITYLLKKLSKVAKTDSYTENLRKKLNKSEELRKAFLVRRFTNGECIGDVSRDF